VRRTLLLRLADAKWRGILERAVPGVSNVDTKQTICRFADHDTLMISILLARGDLGERGGAERSGSCDVK
jgi:hypothetical protein